MRETRTILYLHGFASSGASGTVDLLRREFWSAAEKHRVEIVAPDIPVDPAEALPMLRETLENVLPDLVIGTSMGAMYAQQLRGVLRICVNPSFDLSRKYSILSVGRHKWLSPRKDGSREFHVTKDTVAHFREMEERQFDGITEGDRALCHALFGDSDEFAAAARPVFESHYPGMSHIFPGGHRMNDAVVKHTLIPFIRSLGAI